MLFQTLEFALFLPIVFALYWLLANQKIRYQNALLLSASYVFYGWWDYRFLSLIMLSTLVDYIVGLKIHSTEVHATKKNWLYVSLAVNLGMLGLFKYYNFFIDSWVDLFSLINVELSYSTLYIVLPIGISFYTFQTLSYTLDIYYGRLKPTRNIVDFAAFVSFFPQLVAGPIERASNLLPQIMSKRKFNYLQSTDGLRLILWGLFKKLVIADNLAPIVDEVFTNYTTLPSGALLLGAIYFTFQVYADFSAYSDIAIGTAKLFGFELMSNFKFPLLLSSNIADLWRRWHISLSTWLNDYVFMPMAIVFRNHGKVGMYLSVFITFLVSGLWHGANWTFVFFGFLQGLYFLPIVFGTKRFVAISSKKTGKYQVSPFFILKVINTFVLFAFSMIFFRSASLSEGFKFIGNIGFALPNISILKGIGFVLILVLLELVNIKDERRVLCFKNPILRYGLYFLLIALIFLLQSNQSLNFIYFQF